MKSLIVIGGGITGLAAAYLASRADVRVTVLEGAGSMGGLLATFPVGGTRLECFYHHAFTHDVELLWLLKQLGLEEQMRFETGTMGVYRKGHNYAFNSPADLLHFSPIGWRDKTKFALSSLYLARWANWRDCENISALEWFYRHAGRQTTESLWEPMLRVKFGPYAEKIPLSWMVGRIRQRMNSRKNSGEKLGYLNGSLHVLLESLLRKLKQNNVRLLTGVPVTDVEIEGGELKALHTSAGKFQADNCLFTIPTTHLVRLLGRASETYAAELRQIEYFGAVCTVLELSQPLSSTYWLNVADPGFPFGGVIEHTNLIPAAKYQGLNLVYLSRYFAHDDSLATMSVPAIQKLMLDGLRKIHPNLTDDQILKVHVFSSRTAAVVCDLNFSRKVPACRTPFKRIFMAAMPHIYPDERSCNNSIRVAAEACAVMGLDMSEVPRHASLSGQIGMK